MVTTEYQQQYQELVKIKEANKEVEQIQKQIATGVRDANGEYTNTLQGQRAYLSELQKTFNSQEMGTEEWRKAADELLRVRELVKGIEQSTGDYRRNVGNYPSGAKELVTLFQEYQQQIEETNRSLNELKIRCVVYLRIPMSIRRLQYRYLNLKINYLKQQKLQKDLMMS